MRRNRRLLSPTIYLFLGAATACAVALARDVVGDTPVPYTRPIDLNRDIRWIRDRLPVAVTEQLRPRTGASAERADDYAWRMDGIRTLNTRWAEESVSFRVWRVLPDGTVERQQPASAVNVTRLRRGWPFFCLEGATWTPGTNAVVLDAIVVSAGTIGRTTYLPYRPLWLGLVGNATIYALVAGMLLRAPMFVERLVRRSRTRCPECNHVLAGATRCPECGERIT